MVRPLPYISQGTAGLSGYAAYVFSKLGEKHVRPILDALPANDPADGRHASVAGALEALQLAARDWEAAQDMAIADLGSPEGPPAEALPVSSHEPDEISTTEAADMLDVTERRVCQMLTPGGALAGAGRKVGRRWLVDRGAVLAYRQVRQENTA